MYKTALRVMMVGLVALLGAKVEAHSVVKFGKLYYCSVCGSAQLDEEKPADSTHTEEIEFLLTTKKIELLCPNGLEESTQPVNLVVRKRIDRGDTTRVIDNSIPPLQIGSASTEVVAIVSDLPLKEEKCLVGGGAGDALDALVRQTEVVINTYACAFGDPTKCELISSLSKGNCTLPGRFNLKKYPKNLPPIGVRYDCKVKP